MNRVSFPTVRLSRAGIIVLVWVLVWLWNPQTSAAQPAPVSVRPASVEVGGGLAWSGVTSLGAQKATFTSNQPGTPDRFTFFKVDSRWDAARSVAVWVGANVTPMVGIEGGFQRSRPTIRALIAEDAEDVPDSTLTTTTISQDIIEANAVFHFNVGRFDAQKTVPFALVGGGYLRQFDEDQAFEETGRIFQVGLGFKWVAGIARSGRARGPGVRLDVRYVVTDGGFDFQDKTRRSFVTAGITALVAL